MVDLVPLADNMVVNIDVLKELCSKILPAVDTSEHSILTDTLELVTSNGFIEINVSNSEYHVKVKMPIADDVSIDATVNASLFLKLISQMTSETVEFSVDDNSLVVIGNGTYNIPLIYDDDKILKIPGIDINNITSTFNIDSNILLSILNYNSKELNKPIITKPVQKFYYVDNEGCITSTSGLCINNFTLEKPIKMLLSPKVVKLFKLFDSDQTVKFTYGIDLLFDDIYQPRVRFETDNISITAKLPSDASLMSQINAKAMRDATNINNPYTILVNKTSLLQTINRFMLFGSNSFIDQICDFEFNQSGFALSNSRNKNSEELNYMNNSELSENFEYKASLNLIDLKNIVDACNDSVVQFRFGSGTSFILKQGSVDNVIFELSDD